VALGWKESARDEQACFQHCRVVVEVVGDELDYLNWKRLMSGRCGQAEAVESEGNPRRRIPTPTMDSHDAGSALRYRKRRHPLPLLPAHPSPNQLIVPSNTLLHHPPKTLQQNAPSTITLSPQLLVPALPRHHIHRIPLILPVSQSVPSTMGRAES